MLELLGSVEAARLPGGGIVVAGHGPIDGRLVTSFLDTLVGATADGSAVILDLSDAHSLDDTALAVVGVAAHLLVEREARLGIVAKPPLARLLRSSCLAGIVDLHASLGQAIAG